jgi:hypothetical protein
MDLVIDRLLKLARHSGLTGLVSQADRLTEFLAA